MLLQCVSCDSNFGFISSTDSRRVTLTLQLKWIVDLWQPELSPLVYYFNSVAMELLWLKVYFFVDDGGVLRFWTVAKYTLMQPN